MDYLPLPRNPIHLPLEVPCLCSGGYDGKVDFGGYPERQGWGPMTVEEWKIIFKHPPKEFLAFLQAWLFFGAMELFLEQRVDLSEFTRPVGESGKMVVTMARFLPMLQKWIDTGGENRLHTLPRRSQLEMAMNLLIFLDKEKATNELPTRVVNLPTFMQASNCVNPQDPRIILSEALLHSVLFAIFIRGENYRGSDLYLERDSPSNTHLSEWKSSLFLRMRNDGWCLSEMRVLFHRLNGAGIHFMSHLERPHPNRVHSTIRIHPPISSLTAAKPQEDLVPPGKLCSLWKCSSIQLDEKNYSTKHDEACGGIGCYDMVADEREIFRILKSGSIPLILTIDNTDEDTNLTLVESGPDIAYVAISHVWSDGLGNVQRSALPRCQILRLSKLVRSLPGKASNILLFWIDTIGCPPDAAQQGEAQDLAINKMRQTYEEATAVLVLDSWLVQQPLANLSDAEILMRIVNSTWNSRLWTLQEGALPETLLFQFADGSYDIDEGVVRLKGSDDLALEYTLKGLVTHRVHEIRQFRKDGILEWKVNALMAALAFRSTSVASDEALCLAALLDLDISQIIHTPAEKRMPKFWSMIDRLPVDIIFSRHPRLKVEGYRWAPQSTLRSGGNNSGHHNLMVTRELTVPPAKLTPMGLLVQLPGFVMNIGEHPIGDTFHLCDEHGNWYRFENATEGVDGAVEYDKGDGYPAQHRIGFSINPTDTGGSPLLGIICPSTGDLSLAEIGLDMSGAVLASIKLLVNGVLYVRYLCQSLFTRLKRGRDDFSLDEIQKLKLNHNIQPDEGPNISLSTSYGYDPNHGRLSMVFATWRDNKQQWCVD